MKKLTTLLISLLLIASCIDAQFTLNKRAEKKSSLRENYFEIDNGPANRPATSPVFAMVVEAGADRTICAGGSAALNATAGGGTGVHLYQWNPATGLSNSGVLNPVARPAATTKYILTVTDSAGTVVKDSLTITIDSSLYIPVISILNGPNPFCEGGQLEITASPAQSYLWSTGSINSFEILSASDTITVTARRSDGCVGKSLPFIAQMNPRTTSPSIITAGQLSVCSGNIMLHAQHTDPSVSFSWNTGELGDSIEVSYAGTYEVIATDASGCPSLPAVAPVVGPPVAFIISSGNQTICEGDSIQLTIQTSTDNTVLWNNGNTSFSIWAYSSGNFSASITTPEGCTSNAMNDIDITQRSRPPLPTITANGPVSFCTGGEVVLKANNTISPVSFFWSTGDWSDSIIVQSGGLYSVRSYDDIGCVSELASQSVLEKPLPSGAITASGTTDICDGDSVELSIQAAPGTSFLWNTGDTSRKIQAHVAGNYQASLSLSGCLAPASNNVNVSIKPLPQGTITQSGNELKLMPSANSYQWSFNGQALPAIAQNLSISKGGHYQVRFFANGCFNKVDKIAILRANASDLNYQVYPNPVIRDLNIVYTLKDVSEISIVLGDLAGHRLMQVISNEKQPAGEYQYSLKNIREKLNKGVYILEIIANDKKVVHKVIVL